jgi:hypothetical protein
MKEEIKEILDDLKQCCKDRYRFDIHEEIADILLDYITNLQEKLDFMIDKNDEKQNIIDKAIKELETLLPLCIMPNNTLIHGTEKAKAIEKAINILQGKSDE